MPEAGAESPAFHIPRRTGRVEAPVVSRPLPAPATSGGIWTHREREHGEWIRDGSDSDLGLYRPGSGSVATLSKVTSSGRRLDCEAGWASRHLEGTVRPGVSEMAARAAGHRSGSFFAEPTSPTPRDSTRRARGYRTAYRCGSARWRSDSPWMKTRRNRNRLLSERLRLGAISDHSSVGISRLGMGHDIAEFQSRSGHRIQLIQLNPAPAIGAEIGDQE